MEAGTREVARIVVGRDLGAGGFELRSVAKGAVADERLGRKLVRARARTSSPSTSANTSRRRASTTGIAPGAPAANASSVETPASGRSSASASARAAAIPMRTPVKLPGPMPTDDRVELRGVVDQPVDGASRSRAAATAASARTHRHAGAPPSLSSPRYREPGSTRRSTRSSRAGSAEASATRRRPSGEWAERDREPRRRKVVRRRFRPLDEGNRVVEVRLQVAPLRGGKALETVEIEMGDGSGPRSGCPTVYVGLVTGCVDAERAAGAADEGRLAARRAHPRP